MFDLNGGLSIDTTLTASTTITVTITSGTRTNTASVILVPGKAAVQDARS